MKRTVVVLVCCLMSAGYSFSQDFTPPVPPKSDKKSLWSWDRFYTGGGIGLQFGAFTLINVSPEFAYKLTDRYSVGIGLKYIHIADRRYIPVQALDIYGGSLFNRFILTDFFFLHGEYELLNGPWDPYRSRRFFLNNVWVGGGLRQVTGNASLNIIGLWNLNDEPFNPFPNPQIRMGISIGL